MLKLARLELNKAAWEKVSPEIKADPVEAAAMRRGIAEMNNKATGSIPGKINPVGRTLEDDFYNKGQRRNPEILFPPPGSTASRWARVCRGPHQNGEHVSVK